jgi:hypothetical protein
MQPAVLNVAELQLGLGEKLMNATVPDVVAVTLVNAKPPAVYAEPEALVTSSELPVTLV